MNFHVIGAIFRRNFISYFSSPTGYVFICVFVLLSSFAAFWPSDFFSANLANLGQLNRYLPYIMLVFIPAITMSIWADERRQGTDELLLTIPAADSDVVLGKYFAAVAIFTVALVFSLVSNLLVLTTLGNPDIGLFLGTYLGYWMVGLAMLAIGMTASFLTHNLTVGFILGAAFNAPLVFADAADLLFSDVGRAATLRRWGISEQFRDFGRGVVSLDSVAYFVMIVVLMLYICMVLIGRRHWLGGRDGRSMAGHFFLRTLSLAAVVFGVTMLLQNTGARFDLTSERLSSLSPHTRQLIEELEPKRPVRIEAYVSPNVPEEYVQQRLNLLSTLRELDAMGDDKIQVDVYPVEPLGEVADRAEQQFGIRAQRVASFNRGIFRQENIVLGVAVMSGLEKVVIPFIDRALPVEYELVRSITTVARDKRPTLGVVTTDANLLTPGGSGQSEQIIEELRQQYSVVAVDPAAAITERFDALFVAQPSSLTQPQLDNVLAAIVAGQPTAVFEDPCPLMFRVAGTTQPKQPQMSPFGGMSMPEPKANMDRFWQTLGVSMVSAPGESTAMGGAPGMQAQAIWQDFNPHPKVPLPNEFVFIGESAPGAVQAFNSESPITAGLQEMLFPIPGALTRRGASSLRVAPLVKTGTNTGMVGVDAFRQRWQQVAGPSGMPAPEQLASIEEPTGVDYVLAAHIRGVPGGTEEVTDEWATTVEDEAAEKEEEKKINVILVTDIDLLSSQFVALRSQGSGELELNLDNVPFVLNVVDVLAGEESLVAIRKRRPVHRTLSKLVAVVDDARQRADEATARFTEEYNEAIQSAKTAQTEAIEKEQSKFERLEARGRATRQELQAAQARLEAVTAVQQQRLESQLEQLARKRDAAIRAEQIKLAKQIREEEDYYKLRAVLIPPIFPLLVAFIVFFNRRAKEREGVSKSRLRYSQT